MRQKESDISPTLDLLDERACAYQQCLVFLRQAYPNAAVMTYDRTEARGSEQLLLAKFVIGVGEETPEWLTYQECREETTADNIPGGLLSTVKLKDGSSFTASWYPLLFGRETMKWEGAALLHLHSTAKRRFWIKFGNGNIAFMHFSPNQSMCGDRIDCEQGCAALENGNVILRREGRPLVTSVRGSFEEVHIESLEGDHGQYGTYAVASQSGTDVYAVVGFSEDAERAAELCACDPQTEEQRVIRYYAGLLSQWQLQTPDPAMNEAFGHALLNVEYAWLRPYGWIESIQHWPTMWHMEHTAAEEWNGHFGRVRECLRSQMQRVFENGAIPDLCPTGTVRRDWGGNNQFFFREVEHYIKMTGDLSFAAEAEPFLEKALRQSFQEYDPTGSGVIGWGTQIGNQEDFESTPGKGAATGIEGARMIEILSYIKDILGKNQEAASYAAQAQRSREEWRRTLWKRDIGRPSWYEDILGEPRMETTYHGILYPVLYDALDDADKISALDHVLHRMTGPEGEIYQSNHFGDHAYWGVPTWGMQCGSDMQPFAAAAYAAVGMKREAVRPLSFIARRVCGAYQRGSWPETANEKRFAYFSPSAALFSQAVIESVFGIKRDLPQNRTEIAPSIPEDWPEASLQIPGVKARYVSAQNGFTLHLHMEDDTRKILQVRCPPAFCVEICADGTKQSAKPQHHCGWSSAEFDLGTGRDLVVDCIWEPIRISCDFAPVAACGETWKICVQGDAELTGLDDRCGVFQFTEWRRSNELSGRVRPDLLEPYEPFGWFGRINFARRTVFLRLRARGQELLYPCTFVVLPPVFCRAGADLPNQTISVEVWNQTGKAMTGGWKLLIRQKALTGEGTIPAKGKGKISFSLEKGEILFSPGKNRAVLEGPIHYPVEIEAAPVSATVVPLPLPEEACKPQAYWKEIGLHRSHGHMMQGPDFFLQNLWEQYDSIPILPSVPLHLNPKGFLPFSKEKHPIVTIPLCGRKMKKLYVLCSAFIDNHDVFSKVFRLEAEGVQEDAYFRPVYQYDIYFPGSIDMGFGDAVIAGFATFDNNTGRGRIPELPVGEQQADYPEAQPPAYPQRYLWCENRAIECCHTVLNLLELDFGEFRAMKELRILPCAADAAGGIFALAAHVEEG